jgi:hypothetical protein
MASALYESARHVPLSPGVWDQAAMGVRLQRLVSAVVSAQREDGLWPAPELDFGLSLYDGVAGIVWAHRQLVRRGHVDEAAGMALAAIRPRSGLPDDNFRFFSDAGVPVAHSFHLGSPGILLQLWRETAEDALLDQLDRLIGENLEHPWMENLWGAPGTMLAASHLYEATGEERFAEHIRRGSTYLWQRLEYYPERDCRLWNIELYGESSRLLGAGHGFVGNVFPLLRSRSVLDADTVDNWERCIRETVLNTAVRDGGLANWCQSVGPARRGRTGMLVQQCHGAPGVVIGLASLLGRVDPVFDQLLLDAGELVWQAGPLGKYPGLCHGTAGNGYALLKLYQHTGDSKWLARARAFALTAIERRDSTVGAGGEVRYSLWDGDMGLAMYLADCLDAGTRFPTLDYF